MNKKVVIGILIGMCIGISTTLFYTSATLPQVTADCQDNPCMSPPCCNGDVNGDGSIDISDAVYLLSYLFSDGVEPAEIECLPTYTSVTLPNNVSLDMVYCPSGTFMMGAEAGEQDSYDDEKPQHQVTLTKGFYLGKYEVTKRQWEAVMGTTPWAGLTEVLDDPDSPAVYVSWDDAQEFIEELNKLGQGTFRLPTEAQWEYACRAGTTTRFYWGDDPEYTEIGNYAWYRENAYDVNERYAHVVGQKLPNDWGLYDMSGNVWEWCQDWLGENYYSVSSGTDPTGPVSGSFRVMRGGSWNFNARFCRSADRDWVWPVNSWNDFGFRVVRAPGQ